jgi:hypothetical protein
LDDEPVTVTSSRVLRALLIFCAALCFLGAGMCFWMAVAGGADMAISRASQFALLVPIVLCMLAGGVYLVRSYPDACTTYCLNGSELTIARGNERVIIALDQAQSYSVDSSATVHIIDRSGVRAQVLRSLVHDRDRFVVRRLELALRPALERRLEEIEVLGEVLHPQRTNTVALGALAGGAAWIAIVVILDSSRADLTQRLLVVCILALIAAALAAAARYFSKVQLLAGGSGLTYSTPLGVRTMDWRSVEMMTVRTVRNQHRTETIVMLQSPTGKLQFSSRMRDFHFLKALAERKVSPSAIAKGKTRIAVEEARLKKLQPYARAGLFLMLICLNSLMWYGVMRHRYRLDILDRSGELGLARVIGRSKTGDVWAPYRVEYRFLIDGKEFIGSSRMGKDRLDATALGSEIQIEYLTQNPNLSRLRNSLDREHLAMLFRRCYVNTGLNVGVIGLLIMVSWRGSKKSQRSTNQKTEA